MKVVSSLRIAVILVTAGCLSAQAAGEPPVLYAQFNPFELIKKIPLPSQPQSTSVSSDANSTGLPSFLTSVICLAGGAAVTKAVQTYVKGKGLSGSNAKQKEREILIGAALAGCAVAAQVANSLFLQRSAKARQMVEAAYIESLNDSKPRSVFDPENPKLKAEIQTLPAPSAEDGQECKTVVDRASFEDSNVAAESLTLKYCRQTATSPWKPVQA